MSIESSHKLNVLITGGRSPVALELARQFSAAGHRVFAAESVNYHLCRLSSSVTNSYRVPKPNEDQAGFIQSLSSIIREQKIDLLLPTCEEIYHISIGKEVLSDNCNVFCESINLLDQLHNKMKFIELTQTIGSNVPYTRLLTHHTQLSEIKDDTRFRDKVVFKPVYSRFSTKVQIIDIGKIEHYHLHGQLSANTPWIAQQYIKGRPICTYSIAQQGVITAHTEYSPTFTAGRGASIYFEPFDHPLLLSWVQKFVHHLGFTGQIAFDFIEAEDGMIYPIECNPRATSGLHLLASDDGALARAITCTSLDTSLLLTVAPSQPAKLGIAMLAYGLGELIRPMRWKSWLSAFIRSRDVVYHRHDPKPYMEQLRILLETRHTAKRLNLSFMQATTADIEWNGER